MESLALDRTVLTVADTPVTVAHLLLALLVAALVLILWSTFATRRHMQAQAWREAEARRAAETQAAEGQARMAELVSQQNALAGRLATMQEAQTTAQAALSRSLDERLAGVQGRMTASLSESAQSTQERLAKLQERLAVIDRAQEKIGTLAQEVVGLQAILSNKQTRGAFGQGRMEAIIRDGLPMGAFEFQATLSNRTRPDCVVKMPGETPDLVIDAKFPLEAWHRLNECEPQERDGHAKAFRRDVEVHVKDIAGKYLIPGETQDTAFLFVPSESIFAEIHENHEAIVTRAQAARVVIVSPSLLMLSIQVVNGLMKDARLREEAHRIQAEVALFARDLGRLDERVRKLKSHFDLTAADIDQILISTGKLTRHGAKIEALDLGPPPVGEKVAGKPFLRAIEGGD